ncbi:MAG: prephenate dehydrogenase/arogenate dehydrogenase family protein [Candidatus Omnitrophica bacterium]|nr:prephenate dehydrogenase/arogenate dehydrogenase family protein [Candidatus Omnitrophota bacterium]
MVPKTFAIVGMGLLGGSLAGALRRSFPRAEVIGVSRSHTNIKIACQKKLITKGTTQIKDAVQVADLVFICTPVDTISKLILEVDRYAKLGTVVTDVGSTKGALINWVLQRKFKNISFTGSHPMAGSHTTGVFHATPSLYRDSLVFVTKHHGIQRNALRLVTAVWKKLCRKVVLVNAERHDALVAQISHLPHLVAAALVEGTPSQSLAFASTGFFDTTRIALGDPQLWVPIVMTNRQNLIRLLGRFRSSISQIEAWLRHGQAQKLTQFLKKAALRRQNLHRK